MPSDTIADRIDKYREKFLSVHEVLKMKYLGLFLKMSVFKDNDQFLVGNIEKDKFERVLTLDFSDMRKKTFYVDFIYVSRKFRGKNLASKFYRYLITEHGYSISSGNSQTKGGKHIWNKLSGFNDLDVFLSTTGDTYRKISRKLVKGRYELPHNMDVNDIDYRRFIATKKIKKEAPRMIPYR